MKKFFILIIVMISVTTSYAAEPLSVGSNAKFYAYRFDNEYFLILSFKDDDENRLTDGSVIKFMLTDGKILKLEGVDASKSTKNKSVNWGLGISSGSSSDTHFAIFGITKEQIEMLKAGIDKIAINTIPEVYQRNKWSGKADFGKTLYKNFSDIKDEFEQ